MGIDATMRIDVTSLFQCGTDDNKNIAFTFMGRSISLLKSPPTVTKPIENNCTVRMPFSTFIDTQAILDNEAFINTQPNYSYLGDGFYLVRTQAGFVKAMTHFLGEKNKELEIRTYPKSYPSVITFHIGYDGDLYIRTTSIHVKKLLAEINKND